jgi:hypothetical protein
MKKSVKRERLEEPAEPDRQYGQVVSQAKQCTFCKHFYIKPCSDRSKESCPNFLHLKRGKK